jgi:hypothetical protein
MKKKQSTSIAESARREIETAFNLLKNRVNVKLFNGKSE